MIVLDIDNCISDDSRRIPLIDWSNPDPVERFAAYHADAINDSAYVEGLQGRDDVIIITSRPQTYSLTTQRWLRSNGVRYNVLAMRPAVNRLPSPAFKVVALTEIIAGGITSLDEIEFAYDDRPDVLLAYRQIGLNAVQRKIHDIPYGGPA